jgi:hypothetical protein
VRKLEIQVPRERGDPAADIGAPAELIGRESDDAFSIAINGVVVSGAG